MLITNKYRKYTVNMVFCLKNTSKIIIKVQLYDFFYIKVTFFVP